MLAVGQDDASYPTIVATSMTQTFAEGAEPLPFKADQIGERVVRTSIPNLFNRDDLRRTLGKSDASRAPEKEGGHTESQAHPLVVHDLLS